MKFAYLVAVTIMAVTAMRANLMLTHADYQGGISWLGYAVLSGLSAMRLGWLITHRGTPQSIDVV